MSNIKQGDFIERAYNNPNTDFDLIIGELYKVTEVFYTIDKVRLIGTNVIPGAWYSIDLFTPKYIYRNRIITEILE